MNALSRHPLFSHRKAGRAWPCLVALTMALFGSAVADTETARPLDHALLLAAKTKGDTRVQRDHVWRTLVSLVSPTADGHCPAFTQWHGETETFHPAKKPPPTPFPGQPATTRADRKKSGATMPGGPLITFIHYNQAAFAHIREHRLFQKANLDRRLATPDGEIAPLPRQAKVAMTAWWPVSGRSPTPMPVWDPARQVRVKGANGYLSWPRVVAVTAASRLQDNKPESVAFAGRTIKAPTTVTLDQFFHLAVDAAMAARLMADPQFKTAALIALGRPLQAGDFIALVAMHLMTAELESGVWSTFWWHDRPDRGPFAAGRPQSLAKPWDHYLMDVTFDARLPLEPDGSPNIAFNPWFDATFPDEGEGGGVKANCISCHQRAAYPVTRSMRVTRGLPTPAALSGQVPTALLWSIANTGRVQPKEQDNTGIAAELECP